MIAREIYQSQRKLSNMEASLQSLEYGLYEEAARTKAKILEEVEHA